MIDILKSISLRVGKGILGLTNQQIGEQVGIGSGGVTKWVKFESPIKEDYYERIMGWYRVNGISIAHSDDKIVIEINKDLISKFKENGNNLPLVSMSEVDMADAIMEADKILSSDLSIEQMKELLIQKLMEKNSGK